MGSDPNPCSASLGIIPRSRHGFFGLRPEHDEFLFVKPAVGDELLSQWHLLFSAMPEGLAHSPALPSLMPKDVGYDPTRATGKGSKCRYDSEARIRTRQAVDFLLRSTKADGGHGLNERACTPCMLHIMFSSKPRDFFLKKKICCFSSRLSSFFSYFSAGVPCPSGMGMSHPHALPRFQGLETPRLGASCPCTYAGALGSGMPFGSGSGITVNGGRCTDGGTGWVSGRVARCLSVSPLLLSLGGACPVPPSHAACLYVRLLRRAVAGTEAGSSDGHFCGIWFQ